MGKIIMGPEPLLYPKPAVLVGVNIDDKPSFATYAWCGITSSKPPTISIGVRPHRHTLKGIRQNMTFSVNIPSVDMVRETDYCGLVSGAKTDKVKDCRFKVFYGKLGNAPLIEQCPVNMECAVLHIINLGSHFLVIGRIEETHVSEDCLTDGKPDIMKINPIIFTDGPSGRYHAVGKAIAEAFSIGREIKKED
ncbi:MAG: NADPH-flavin oxidoreductase [Chloroflexi bacterium RBG_16_50_9]|nr:MAG: NADPH-flavin oxidoreductase [Chloroflexi bacterium RBG_16_50_9]